MKNAETSINEVQLIQRLEDQNGVINSVACYGNQLIASGSGLVGIHLFEILFGNRLNVYHDYILSCNIRQR